MNTKTVSIVNSPVVPPNMPCHGLMCASRPQRVFDFGSSTENLSLCAFLKQRRIVASQIASR